MFGSLFKGIYKAGLKGIKHFKSNRNSYLKYMKKNKKPLLLGALTGASGYGLLFGRNSGGNRPIIVSNDNNNRGY